MTNSLNEFQSKTTRIFYGWWVAGASFVGISASPQPIVVVSIGLFMQPLANEFGWSRSEISFCITLMTLSIALSLPLAGRLLDRYGTRKIVLPSILALGLSLVAIPLFVTRLWHLAVVFFVIGTLGVGSNAISYLHVLSAWFNKHRGMSIGIAMSGMGAGFFYVPIVVQFMIDQFGWRAGYYTIGAVVLLISMPVVFMWLKDSPDQLGLKPDGMNSGPIPKSASKMVGLDLREILQTSHFWMLIVIFGLISFVISGLVIHLVPMLIDRGMQPSTAALVMSCFGVSLFFGRIIIGYLIDRFFAPRVAMCLYFFSCLGVLIFAIGAEGAMAFVAAATIGFTYGLELDLVAYLASRYFGLRSLGTACGLLLTGILAGAAAAPLAFALWFDITGSYMGVLILSLIGNILAGVITAMLGPYPNWDHADLAERI